MLRGRWCDIIVLNGHAPTEDKIDDVKDSFYDGLERVFDKFSKYEYHMKILLRDFNANVGRGLHKISNNGVGLVNFATSKNLKNTMTSPILGRTASLRGHSLPPFD
jgi:hypothetical protein